MISDAHPIKFCAPYKAKLMLSRSAISKSPKLLVANSLMSFFERGHPDNFSLILITYDHILMDNIHKKSTQ